jgi:hypothetical protein
MEMNDEGTGNVTLLRDNVDGSAVYQFDFPPETVVALTRLGILTAIKAGIGEAKKLAPDYDAVEFTEEIKDLAEEAGFSMWENESWKPEGEVVDWASKYDKELIRFYHLVKEKNGVT